MTRTQMRGRVYLCMATLLEESRSAEWPFDDFRGKGLTIDDRIRMRQVMHEVARKWRTQGEKLLPDGDPQREGLETK